MLYINNYCGNYAEFKEFFKTTDGSRKNAVILSWLKWAMKADPKHRRIFIANRRFNLQDIYDAVLLYVHCASEVATSSQGAIWKASFLNLPQPIWTRTIESDDMMGVCKDKDERCVRFIRHLTADEIDRTQDGQDHPRVKKTKAGRLMREMITQWMPTLPEAVLNYVCETFAAKWFADRVSASTRYELHVDVDFCSIYNGDEASQVCLVEGSCMGGENQWSFYRDAVKAHAAYLIDTERDDKPIVARCIIFDEVMDNEGNIYRYAERQYTESGESSLKQLLLNKLMVGGHIDIYKEATAGCWDKRRIRRVSDNELLEDLNLHINCRLSRGDILSFQDTFGYYNYNQDVAYNYAGNETDDISVTDSRFRGEWDSYHERYCESVETVYIWNSCSERYYEETCDKDDLEDFRKDYYNDEWYNDGVDTEEGHFYNYNSTEYHECTDGNYHDDDTCHWSAYSNAYIYEDDAIEIDGKYYLKSDCGQYDEDDVAYEDGVYYISPEAE